MENSEVKMAHVGYLLLALGFVLPILPLIGVIINYVKRGDVHEPWLFTHYEWQITTFWVWLIFSAIGGILIIVLVGYVILIAVAIWVIYRIVKGWMKLTEQKAVW